MTPATAIVHGTATGKAAAPAWTAGAVAALLSAELVGPADLPLTGFDAIEKAGPGALTFIRSPDFASMWTMSKASAAVVTRGVNVPGHDPTRRALLIVPNADLAVVRLLGAIAPASPKAEAGIDPSASVHAGAEVAEDASIGPHCTVEEGAKIGSGAVLVAGVYVGRGSSVGAGSVLMPGVSVLERCHVGRRCVLNPGVVIGADGFGYVPAPGGKGLVKVPHIGGVRIEDDVEIGANSCVDRGKIGDTTIGAGTKIDNLVQIAHNCRVGRACIICGMCAIAGSVEVGDGAVFAGGVRVVDNVKIGAGAKIGAGSGVMDDIPEGEEWLGSPARRATETLADWAAIRRLRRERARKRRGGEEGGRPSDNGEAS